MWNSFFRAWFLLGMIVGVEEVCFSAYWFWNRNRLMGYRWLLRGSCFLAVYSFLLWWLSSGSLDPWNDVRFWVLALSLAPVTIGIDALLRVLIEHKPLRTMFSERPQPNITSWKQTRMVGKLRFVRNYVLAFSLMVLTPAIVFSIAAPDLLHPYWWLLIVVGVALMAFLIGNRQWNINEKQLD